MPLFLSRYELYRIIQRELPPDDVYPDSGTPSGFFSTSDSDATAAVLSDYYRAQKQTYDNYFAISATGSIGRLPDHEITWFGYNLDSTIYSEAQRLGLVLTQIRRQPAPTLWNILTLALTFVPQGVVIGIAAYNDQGDAADWQLGVSLLGINTNLAYGDSNSIQAALNAFGYEVRIFGYTLTAQEYTALNLALLAQEPARSYHVIRQNLNLSSYGLIYQTKNINAYSLINVAYVDPTSLITGYTGYSDVDNNPQIALTDQSGNILITQGGDTLVLQY